MSFIKSVDGMRPTVELTEVSGAGRSSLILNLILFCIATYFCFYGLIPRAYSVGPAVIFLMALVLLRRSDLQWGSKPFHIGWVALFLFSYCAVQWLILLIHGEDISEFDLSFRYIAAATVLVFLSRFNISADLIFRTSAAGAILSGCFALYQSEVANVVRVESFDNAIHFGNGAMALSLICLCGLLGYSKERRTRLKVAALATGFVAASYAALVSGSRGVWIAFPVVMLVLIILYWKRIPTTRKLLGSLIVIVILAALTTFTFDSIEKRVGQAVKEYAAYFDSGKNGTSVGLRLDLWKAGLVAFKEQPLIGVGPAGVDRVVAELIEQEEIHPQTRTFRHLHNQYVDILARQGLAGLIFYAALIISIMTAFIALFRSSDITKEGHALAAAGIAFVSQHLFVNLTLSMLERSIGIMMFVFLVVFFIASASSERETATVKN